MEKLQTAALIHDDQASVMKPASDWHTSFRCMGTDVDPSQGPRVIRAEAALAGVGLAPGRRASAIRDIHDGRYAMPFRTAFVTLGRIRFVCPRGTKYPPQVRAFRAPMPRKIDKTGHISVAPDLREIKAAP